MYVLNPKHEKKLLFLLSFLLLLFLLLSSYFFLSLPFLLRLFSQARFQTPPPPPSLIIHPLALSLFDHRQEGMTTEGGGLARDVHQAFSQTFLASTGAEAAAYAAEMLLELLASPEEVAAAAAHTTAGGEAEQADPLLSLQHLVALAMPQAQQEDVEVAALRLLDRDILRRAEAEAEAMQQAQAQQLRTLAATTPGTDVLALLPQDGEYHPATVVCRAKTQVAPACEDKSSSGASGSRLGVTPGRKGRRAAAKAAAAAAAVQQQVGTSARGAGVFAKRKDEAETSQDAAVVVNFFEFGGLEVTVPLAKIIPLSEDSEAGGDDDEDAGSGSCELCGRDSVRLTRHHLRPRQLHARLLAQGVGRETLNLTTNLCRSCHSMVHRAESNMDLALRFNTIEALRTHPVLARWAVYAARLRTSTKWDHAVLVSKRR